MIDSATLNKLNEQPWEDLFISLNDYTDILLKRYGVRFPNIRLPKGYDAQMVVDEAIESIYSGRRTWNHKEKPDFKLFITTQVIRSVVWNLFASKEHELVKELVLTDEDGEDSDMNPLELQVADSPSILENIYEREFLDQVLQLVQQHDKSDEQLEVRILEGRLIGKKNNVIAQELNIPINVVEAAMKRLRKVLLPLLH
jgi:hypothetical protein